MLLSYLKCWLDKLEFVSQRSWTLWRSGWRRSSAKCLTSEYERPDLSVPLKACCHYVDFVSTSHNLLQHKPLFHLFLFSPPTPVILVFTFHHDMHERDPSRWAEFVFSCSARLLLCSVNRCGTFKKKKRESACISCLHESHATSSFLSLSFQLQDYIFLCWANEAILSSDFNSLS